MISETISTITEKTSETTMSGTDVPKTSMAITVARLEATMIVTIFRIRMAVRNWLGSRSSASTARLPATFCSTRCRTRSFSTEVSAVSEPEANAATSEQKDQEDDLPPASSREDQV